MPARTWLLATTLSLAAAPLHAQAPAWKPERQIEIVVGTTAGGPQDRTGRVVQKILQERKLVDVPVVVTNKPGGGGAIGLGYLNQHPGDAHLLMVNAVSIITNYATGKSKLNYTDFTPIAITGIEYVVAAVRTDSPLRSAGDMIDALKKDPSSLSVAVGTALGNSTHLSIAHAMKRAGVDIRRMKPVVFPSGSQSATAALGGHVDVATAALSSVLAQVKGSKMRLLAIGAPEPVGGELAGVPTWKQLGIDSAFDLWRGLAAPRGLTPAQIAFWDAALGRLVRTDDWKQDLARNAMADVYKTSAETARHWKQEHDEVVGVLAELGLAAKQ